MKHNYFERKENRIAFAKEQAEKHLKLSDHFCVRSNQMASVIPMGQPILIGHYSETRDRNYRAKIWNLRGKSVEADNTAKYYAEKAKTIENYNAISSDNPDAVDLLKNKLSALVAQQEFMKAANMCIKQNDKAAYLKLGGNATEILWADLNTPRRFGGPGYARFELTNNGATIRSTKKRIEQLEKLEARTAVDIIIKGIRIIENKEANRLQILFGSKPAQSIRDTLSKHGFRWCRTEIAWQRNIGNSALYYAKEIVNNISDEDAREIATPAERLL